MNKTPRHHEPETMGSPWKIKHEIQIKERQEEKFAIAQNRAKGADQIWLSMRLFARRDIAILKRQLIEAMQAYANHVEWKCEGLVEESVVRLPPAEAGGIHGNN